MTEEEFQAIHCLTLNEQQKQAVSTVDGAVLLLAVPGSGKTTVLVTRLGYLIYCKGVAPEAILTMTYTKEATKEMKHRFQQRFGTGEAHRVEFRTINGVCAKIIEYYGEFHSTKKPFRLLSQEQETAQILQQIYGRYSEEYATNNIIKELKSAITYCKNMQLTEEEIKEHDTDIADFPEIFKEYCMTLRTMESMDYDDQMVYALGILKTRPAVLAYFQKRYLYFCVDESQDTSKIQHEIIRVLAGDSGNLFMVGDEDQSIYGFRAAYPRALIEFQEHHKSAQILLMEHNYRSKKEILSIANGFVANNQDRHEKQMKETRGAGLPVSLVSVESRRAQFYYMFGIISRAREEIGVLFRNNYSALPLIDLCEQHGVPYRCKQNEHLFFSSRVVMDLLDTLFFMEHSSDTVVFLRLYYKFPFYLKKEWAEKACFESRKTGKDILDVLGEMEEISKSTKEFVLLFGRVQKGMGLQSATGVLQQIWEELSYFEYVEKNCFDRGSYFILSILSEGAGKVEDFLGKMQHLQYLVRNHENLPGTMVTLSTVHSCKGLEYDSVYLLDMYDGILPVKTHQELIDLDMKEELPVYEEDRRLYYVALTRARNRLYLFDVREKSSSFHKEAMSFQGKEVFQAGNVLSGLGEDWLGKYYMDRDKGKGVIVGQGDLRYLVEFPTGEMELFTLAEMYAQRESCLVLPEEKTEGVPTEKGERSSSVKEGSVSKEKAATVHLGEESVEVGDYVEHKLYGKGVVTDFDGKILEVEFRKLKGRKKFDLVLSVQGGYMTLGV